MASVSNLPIKPGSLAASVEFAAKRELAAAGRLDTHLGAAALALARRIDESTAVMGFAALVRELRQTMTLALLDQTQDHDVLDEIHQSALRVLHGTDPAS